METQYLKLETKKAQEAYKKGNAKQKKLLIDLYGEEAFLLDVKDRVLDYKSACKELGLTPLTLEHFDFLPEEDQERTFARHQVVIGVRALVGDWRPDFRNGTWKYYTYGVEDSNGLRLDGDDCSYYSFTGSDLLFPNAELRDHAQNIFKSQYLKFLFNR